MLISKKNEVFLKLECEPHIGRQLSDYFTFDVPGAKFMPSFRNRIWDGKIRLYNIMKGEIYVGLYSYITEYLQEQEINYTVSEELLDGLDISNNDVQAFTNTLNLRTKSKKLKARDYQITALAHAIRNHRTLLLSPTASGKSLIIYCLVRYYLEKVNHFLIIVPTTSLVEQMSSDFVDYGWQESNIQKIYSGHDREVTKPVVISTWQSLYKFPIKYFEQFGAVVGDECHLFKAKSLTSLMHKLHLTKYRFGLTGTLDGSQTHRLVLEGLFGKVQKVVTTKELIDNKTISDLHIEAIVLTYSKEECKIVKNMKYQEAVSYTHLTLPTKRIV